MESISLKLNIQNYHDIWSDQFMANYCSWSVTKSCLLLCYPWTAAFQASLPLTISQSLLKLMSIESVMPSNCLTHCHPLLLLHSIYPRTRSFPMSWLCIKWLQYWSTEAPVLPMNIQGWFPLGLTGLIPLLSKRFSRVISSNTV